MIFIKLIFMNIKINYFFLIDDFVMSYIVKLWHMPFRVVFSISY